MINIKQELLSYPPIDIESLTAKDSSIPDNIVNSIVMYNKALDNIRLNSEDIAIIELKKAISMNPDFHEAFNLLGICYVYIKDYAKAAEMFEKVMALEKNGVKALNYLNAINNGNVQIPDSDKKGALPNPISRQNTSNIKNVFKSVSSSVKIENKELFGNAGLIRIVGGFAAGIAVMSLFIILMKEPAKNTDIQSSLTGENKVQSEQDAALVKKVEELTESSRKLEEQLQQSNAELGYYKSISKLNEVESLSAARKYEAAADLLVMMKTIQFKEAEKKRYDSLYKNVIPKAAWAVFNEGNNLSRSGKYKEALTKLSKVQIYGSDWNYLDATYYRMGICYKELNESKNALEMFQKLLQNYPSSQYAQYANYRIAELTGAP